VGERGTEEGSRSTHLIAQDVALPPIGLGEFVAQRVSARVIGQSVLSPHDSEEVHG